MDVFSFAVGVFVCLLAQVFMMVLLIVAAKFGERKKKPDHFDPWPRGES